MGNKGITLIELLIALVIGAIIVGGIYRVYIAQTRAYTVQDQVIEVQQNIRSAMEILLRDIRMAGYDGSQTPDRLLTAIFPGNSITNSISSNAITVQYRINGILNTKVIYMTGAQLMENSYVNGVQDPNYPVVLLDNVSGLTFTYGVDGQIGLPGTQNGTIADSNGDGTIGADDFIDAATVSAGNLNPIAVRVVLSANPSPVDPDIPQMVQPRTLVSAITLRNLCLLKAN